ncbi:unnamed protein product [Colias eurytheme]|nr:unnamed protein product [Colias eurytheme]
MRSATTARLSLCLRRSRALTGPRLSKPCCSAMPCASSWRSDRLNRTRKELVNTSREYTVAMSTVAVIHCSHMITVATGG